MRRLRVIVLSITDFTDSKNGGGMWAQSLLRSLARVPDVHFTIVSMGHESVGAANSALVRQFGLEHVFVSFRPERFSRSGLAGRVGNLVDILLEKYFLPWERVARGQLHVDDAVMQVIKDTNPDLIVINYLFAALFAPSIFRLPTPRCLITLNNETEFHRLLKSQGGPPGNALRYRLVRYLYRHGNWIPNERVRRYEKWVYAHCAGAVALTENDLPPDLPQEVVRAVLPPILEQNSAQWRFQATRSLFFVGNVGYYANRLAIEWLCTRLAPELMRIEPGIRINIIGAGPEHAPPGWRSPNINLMGYSDKAGVVGQMTSADLFIAPIQNNFGAKIKLAECVSYGMPFVGTEAAMSGLPFLKMLPRIDLQQPAEAARLVAQLLSRPQSLRELSEQITRQAQQARVEQLSAWGAFLNRAAGGKS